MCLNCSTVCGMIASVEDGKILKLDGNPSDPNARGKLCAKGQAAINMVEDPHRILYPMRRVGARGSGKWERITWDAAIDEIALRLRRLRAVGQPEKLLLQYGRDRTNGFLDRFTDAFGTPHKLGHRGLCSLNKRMAIKHAIGATDWDTADFSHSRFILNFGSNFYEAHQGHVGMLQRVAEAKRKGAYVVTFDVRLSNTAAQSNEWQPLFPGTDGLVALAIGHVILRENLQDTEFLTHWTNATLEEWRLHYQRFTPEYAEQESGIPASDIERIARAFAKAAPHVTTVSNRGAHAHQNGFHNEWAILCLNAMVGSIGAEGGWSYIPGDVNRLAKQPGPRPPKPTKTTELSHPTQFPFANFLYPRAVSSFIYPYLEEKRETIDTLISYYVNAPMSWPQGPSQVRNVLLNEDVIPFHVAIDAFYSETAEVADLVLPDATFLEKWDLDSRNSYDFREYVGLRQPVVSPPGECRDIRDILIAIANAVDEEMASYFAFRDAEDFVRQWAESVPGGLTQLQRDGIWVNTARPQQRAPHLEEIDCSLTDDNIKVDNNGVVWQLGEAVNGVVNRAANGALNGVVDAAVNGAVNGKANWKAVGRLYKNKVVRGFQTEDRLFQFKSRTMTEHGLQVNFPSYLPIESHRHLQASEAIFVTFKWNVHTQSRTANQKWLTEIIGDNPCWIHPSTAATLGIVEGGLLRISRSPVGRGAVSGGSTWPSVQQQQPQQADGPDQKANRMDAGIVVRAHLTEAIHPKVVAISASFGHWQYGGTAKGRGVNPNVLIAANADAVGGGQSWNDTVVTLSAP